MSSNSILTALKKDSIIPDIIPPNFTPSMTLSVAYSNGKDALLGNELTRVNTLDEPVISFAPIASGEENAVEEPEAEAATYTYTVVMTDPDAPSRADPKYGEVKHWIMTGVKQSRDGTTSTTGAKHVVTPYAPPGPPPGTGLHRYIFLLFREPPSTPSSPSSPSVPIIPHGATEYGAELKDRINWNAMHFAERYGLELVGVNWFLARSLEG